MNTDLANLNKYALENKYINYNARNVVFMAILKPNFGRLIMKVFLQIISFFNVGISEQSTSQILLRFRQDVIDFKPTAVVILAGINDIAENTEPISIKQIMGNIISMVALAKANKIKVIFCSVLPANKLNWNTKLQPANNVIHLNQMIVTYASKHKITYID